MNGGIRCSATNSQGKPCRGRALEGGLCANHQKPKKKLGRPKPPPSNAHPIAPTTTDDPEPRTLELARELVESLEGGMPFRFHKVTELFEALIGEPLSLDQTRSVVSYGVNTAMKFVQNSTGTVSEWVPDWAARRALSGELRSLSKWDDAPPADKEPENLIVVRMPCPAETCPNRRE